MEGLLALPGLPGLPGLPLLGPFPIVAVALVRLSLEPPASLLGALSGTLLGSGLAGEGPEHARGRSKVARLSLPVLLPPRLGSGHWHWLVLVAAQRQVYQVRHWA